MLPRRPPVRVCDACVRWRALADLSAFGVVGASAIGCRDPFHDARALAASVRGVYA